MRQQDRQQLETDALVVRVDQAVDWARANRGTLLTAIAGVVGLGLLLGGFLVNRSNRREAVRNELGTLTAEISGVVGGEQGQLGPCETALAPLEELARAEGGSVEGRTASYYAGICHRAFGDHEAAAASFRAARGGGDLLGDLATLALAGVQQRSGNAEEAAASYRSLLDGRGPLPLDPVLYELGVLEERLGRPEAATGYYDRLADEYPASGYLELAEARRERLPS